MAATDTLNLLLAAVAPAAGLMLETPAEADRCCAVLGAVTSALDLFQRYGLAELGLAYDDGS
jgi:hypothetical protein